ncbi:MAG TPA: prolipoprotein diacylglyceryl transferase [Acholeplasma sp.]|jgi:phosphatidylglycerol:prolipoprotein diacylglycerol transferase
MSKTFKKYQGFIVYGGIALLFLFLLMLATVGQTPPYNKFAISFGSGNGIAWYAVFILAGIISATVLGYLEFRRFGVNTDILFDGLLYCVPLAIIGARLWFVIFNLDDYNSIGEMFAIWNGGLAIHGGVIFAFIFVYFFSKYKKVSFWWFLDVVAPGFLIGQTFGRWGNFMNQELYGPVVENLNWLPSLIRDQMFINGAFRHPTFLYESLINLVGLIIILALRRKKLFKLGDIVALYLLWYGMARIPNELLRLQSGVAEPLMIGGVSVSVLTSIGFIIAGIAIIIGKRIYAKDLPYYSTYGKHAVLFDLDGTLLDTKDIIYDNIKRTFAIYQPDRTFTEKELKAFVGPTLEESFSWYEKDHDKVLKMVETYREFNRENHDKGVNAFPNVEKVFKTLKENDYMIGIVSSKKTEFVTIGLDQHNLSQYVDIIIGADDVLVHKPDPTGIKKALEALSVPAENTFYVGDHANDIKAAQNALVKSIGVSYSIHYEDLLAAKPDYVVDDLEKILEIV